MFITNWVKHTKHLSLWIANSSRPFIRNTVSGEYRHPVPVSPDTVIQCRHPVPDRYRIHPVPYPVPPLIRYRHPELDDGFGYWIPVIGYRYWQIPVPDDGPDNGRRTLPTNILTHVTPLPFSHSVSLNHAHIP